MAVNMDEMIQQIEQNPKISVRTCTEVECATGDDHLEKLTLVDNRTGVTEEVSCARMFIFIGAAPRTEWLDGVLARDDHGFILTGADAPAERLLQSSVPGVYAAGDVRAGSTKRCATAVGEGAMVVQLVHAHIREQGAAHARP